MRFLFRLYPSFFSIFLFMASASAADRLVQVPIHATFEPKVTLGLVMRETGTTQKLETESTRDRFGNILVSFKVADTDIDTEGNTDTFVTAIAISEEDEIAFGEMRPLISGMLKPAHLTMPDCPTQSALSPTIQGQFAQLQSLVAVRKEMRDKFQAQLRTALSGELLTKLQKLEDGFGFRYEYSLSPDLPPFELLQRLTRLNMSIKNVKENKVRSVTNSSSEAQ